VAREMDKMNRNGDLKLRFHQVRKHQYPYLPHLNSNTIHDNKLLRASEAQDKVDEYALYKAKMVEKRQKRHTC